MPRQETVLPGQRVIMAILCLYEGKSGARMVCVGCTQLLEETGMVRVRYAVPMDPLIPGDFEHVTAVYEMCPGVSLDACRERIKDRHIGGPWGS